MLRSCLYSNTFFYRRGRRQGLERFLSRHGFLHWYSSIFSSISLIPVSHLSTFSTLFLPQFSSQNITSTPSTLKYRKTLKDVGLPECRSTTSSGAACVVSAVPPPLHLTSCLVMPRSTTSSLVQFFLRFSAARIKALSSIAFSAFGHVTLGPRHTSRLVADCL